MEQIYLQKKNFIGGDEPSIADLIAFFDVTMLECTDFDYSPFPVIQAWVKRMKAIPAVVKANERFEGGKENLKELYKQNMPKL